MKETTVANDVKNALRTLRVVRHDARVKIELARMRTNARWQKLEAQLGQLERAAERATPASRDAIIEGIHELEKFSASLPGRGF